MKQTARTVCFIVRGMASLCFRHFFAYFIFFIEDSHVQCNDDVLSVKYHLLYILLSFLYSIFILQSADRTRWITYRRNSHAHSRPKISVLWFWATIRRSISSAVTIMNKPANGNQTVAALNHRRDTRTWASILSQGQGRPWQPRNDLQ